MGFKEFLQKHAVNIDIVSDDEYKLYHRQYSKMMSEKSKNKKVKEPKAQRPKKEKKLTERGLKAINSRKLFAGDASKIRSYKLRANAKRIPFTLSQDEFDMLIDADCVYCGGSGVTIDRRDCKKGYTPDNSVPCCQKCNTMKFTYDVDTFLKHISKIFNHHNREDGTS